jgi:hypothetical protein
MLHAFLIATAIGALVLIPSIALLFATFKTHAPVDAANEPGPPPGAPNSPA